MDLIEGATDGKYRKVRPDTSVQPGTGHEQTLHDRSTLYREYNYGFIAQEIPPGSRSIPGM